MKKWLHPLLWIMLGMVASAAIFLISSPPRGKPVELLPAPTAAPILIHVDGAVKSPGVYGLPRDSRLQDAINEAGGFTDQANQGAVNLATRLKDGDKVHIPTLSTPSAPEPVVSSDGEPTAAPSGKTRSGAANAATATPSGPVNINTATLEELQTLTGIGPTRAQDIIDYREAHGGFKTIEEIQNVKGIGPATFEKLKDRITVN